MTDPGGGERTLISVVVPCFNEQDVIGLTHQRTSGEEPELPGAKPTWFFAPDQIRKRASEWGPGGIEQRFGAAWSGFAPKLERWIKLTEGRGQAAVKQVYLDTLGGRVPPEQGHILSLAE